MSVLVDSSVWSLAFRRKTVKSPEAIVLADLVARGEARIIGAVRQEVLTGIRDTVQFTRIRQRGHVCPVGPCADGGATPIYRVVCGC